MMEHNQVYITYRDTMIEALDHLDEFKEKMESFIEKHPEYSYEDEVNKVGKKWELKVNVLKDESSKIGISE